MSIITINIEYASDCLGKSLLDAPMKPGTWLEPNRIDNLIHIHVDYPGFSEKDPFYANVPVDATGISWKVGPDDADPGNAPMVANPNFCFLELTALDNTQLHYPTAAYWNEYFITKDPAIVVAPNGRLYCDALGCHDNTITLKLGKTTDDFYFSYTVVFTIDVIAKGQKPMTYYCRVDPLASIRST